MPSSRPLRSCGDRWVADGTWDRLLTKFSANADVAGELDWVVSVDSSINRVHEQAAGAPKIADTDPAGHTGGRVEWGKAGR